MSFWANKIAPQQAPAPVAPPTPTGPWWATQARQVTPVAPVVVQPQQPVQYGSETPQNQPGQSSIGELLAQPNYQTTKAKSSTTHDHGACPECQGPNYIGEAGRPNSMPHCYDCGYNPRFGQQSMSGVSAGQNVPVKTARQQHGGQSDFNPGVIIGHV